MSNRHRRADLNGLELWCVVDTATPAVTRATGMNANDADISFTDTGAGDMVMTINPFRGPKGEAYGVATSMTISTFCSITAFTYTADSLAVTIKIENDASTATDAPIIVHLYAE